MSKYLRHLLGFALIVLMFLIAEAAVKFTGIKFPSTLLGMLLLTLSLRIGIIKLNWVKDAADFLLKYVVLFFVPPGVAIMLYFDLIAKEWLPITVATVVSTIAVFVATGWTHQILRRMRRKK